jgi:hypothetical protein
MAGRYPPMLLKTKCSSWLRTDIVALPMIGAATADQINPGMATISTPTQMISRNLLKL